MRIASASFAGFERVEDVLVVVERRQNQHSRARAAFGQGTRCRHPVQARHPQVHQDHVGAQGRGPHSRLRPVPRLADDLDPVLQLQQGAQAVAHQTLIVDDQHADNLAARRIAGLCHGVPPIVGQSAVGGRQEKGEVAPIGGR